MYGIEKKWEKNLNGFYIKNAGYNENPFQSQNGSRSALKLRFLIGWGYVRAATLRPAWGFHPQTPSSLRGGFKA